MHELMVENSNRRYQNWRRYFIQECKLDLYQYKLFQGVARVQEEMKDIHQENSLSDLLSFFNKNIIYRARSNRGKLQCQRSYIKQEWQGAKHTQQS